MDGTWTAFGPGKVILLGEHAVVYGQPALAGALSWGVTAKAESARKCELVVPGPIRGERRAMLESAFARAADVTGKPKIRVTLQSNLPVSVGLGSSAAVGVAVSRVLLEAAGKRADAKAVASVALEMEKEFHGTPSGLDHTTSAMNALIVYRRSTGESLGVGRVVKCPRPLKVMVALVGKRRATKETVGALRRRMEQWPSRYERLIAEVGRLAQDGIRAVEGGDLEGLGDAMNANHGLLSALGVTSASLDEMVHRLREAGALGAKMTGAGGDGGAVVALFLEPEPMVARLRRAGVQCFTSQIAGPQAL